METVKEIGVVTVAALVWALATSAVSAWMPGGTAFLGAVAFAGAALLVGEHLLRPGAVRWELLDDSSRGAARVRLGSVLLAALAFLPMAALSLVLPELSRDPSTGARPPATEFFVDEVIFLSPLVAVIGMFGGIGRAALPRCGLAASAVGRR